ncbi:MAG: glycosyltransferase, partial [Phycisphaerae bacterium]
MTASPLASSTRITPIHAQPLRIGVFGNPNLTVRLVDLLRRHHLAAQLVGPGRPEPTGSLRRWRQWLLGGRFDLIHGLGCFQYWPAWLAARSLRIATVCEFIGSDVLELQAWPRRRRLWLTAIRTCVDVCMADGRWLAAELARYGLSVAIVNAALPVYIPASPP